MGLLNLKHKLDLNHQISEAVENKQVLTDPRWWRDTIQAADGVKELRDMETTIMSGFFGWLSGKKTYFIAVATGAVTALHAMGKISDTLYQTLLGLLGAGGIAAVRAAISNLGVKI